MRTECKNCFDWLSLTQIRHHNLRIPWVTSFWYFSKFSNVFILQTETKLTLISELTASLLHQNDAKHPSVISMTNFEFSMKSSCGISKSTSMNLTIAGIITTRSMNFPSRFRLIIHSITLWDGSVKPNKSIVMTFSTCSCITSSHFRKRSCWLSMLKSSLNW